MATKAKTRDETDQPRVEGSMFQWAVPSSLEIPVDPLRLRLDFHTNGVTMTTFEGPAVNTKLVSALDVAHALSRELSISSGLLPPNAIWWLNTKDGPVYALWQEPKVWKIALAERFGEPPLRFALPMPGLIFLCQPGQTPWVYAARHRPKTPNEKVFKAPCYNVFANGRVCPGTHKFPVAVGEIPTSFFRSFFAPTGDTQDRSKKHPRDLTALWRELDGKRTYPVDDLVEHGTVEDLMAMHRPKASDPW